MRLLLPLDGSLQSERALFLARWLLRPAGGAAHLLRIVPPDSDEAEESAESRRLQNAAAPVLGEAVDMTIEVAEEEGPVPAILAAARELEPDLVLLSPRRMGALTRWWRGSVTERVLRGSTTPVLACPSDGHRPGPDPETVARILVPLDGSARSTEVLPLVERLVEATGAEVVLLRCVQPLRPLAVAGHLPVLAPLEGDHVASTQEWLRPFAEQLHRAGLPVRSMVEHGAPARGILAAAARADVDLIAMTTRAPTRLQALLCGSVGLSVLRKSDRPVLLQRVPRVPVSDAPPNPSRGVRVEPLTQSSGR